MFLSTVQPSMNSGDISQHCGFSSFFFSFFLFWLLMERESEEKCYWGRKTKRLWKYEKCTVLCIHCQWKVLASGQDAGQMNVCMNEILLESRLSCWDQWQRLTVALSFSCFMIWILLSVAEDTPSYKLIWEFPLVLCSPEYYPAFINHWVWSA